MSNTEDLALDVDPQTTLEMLEKIKAMIPELSEEMRPFAASVIGRLTGRDLIFFQLGKVTGWKMRQTEMEKTWSALSNRPDSSSE